jgi:hypothetical protein
MLRRPDNHETNVARLSRLCRHNGETIVAIVVSCTWPVWSKNIVNMAKSVSLHWRIQVHHYGDTHPTSVLELYQQYGDINTATLVGTFLPA